MNDAEPTSFLGPDAPTPPPYTPKSAPAYAASPASPRPRFVDRVLGMRAVLGVALAGLILGGTGGAILGATTNGGNDGFGGRGPGGLPGGQRGTVPGQGPLPTQQLPFGPGQTSPRTG